MRAHPRTADDSNGALALHRCARGELPPNVALTHLFMAAADEAQARRMFDATLREYASGTGAAPLGRARELWESAPDAFDLVKTIAGTLAHDHASARGAGDWGALFDRAADMSAEGSVALYTLGRPELLDAVTREIVAFMQTFRLLAPSSAILEIGCGNARVLSRLAPQVGAAIGIDVSTRMLGVARGRPGNFALVRSSGRDLAAFANASFDGVYAVDVFPYLVQSGLAQRHLDEIARVLKPNGWLLILNYSYRGDLAADRADIATFASASDFAIRLNGTPEFSLWDGACFLLQRSR
jgi:SAM-dependent methyltransferase